MTSNHALGIVRLTTLVSCLPKTIAQPIKGAFFDEAGPPAISRHVPKEYLAC
jgi:hypothetical protein